MNVTVMIGSLRKGSYHRKLYEVYQQLAKGVLTFTEISTADFPLYNGDLEASKPAIIETHADSIRAADGHLFITPEYNYSIPGHLKNAIDWLSRVDNQPFNGKKVGIIGGSPGAVGTARMQYDLRKVGVFLNLHFLNKPEVMVGKLFDKFNSEGELNDSGTREFLEKHLGAFVEFIGR